MAKKKLEKQTQEDSALFVERIKSAKDMAELVEIMKPLEFKERTKEIVQAVFEKTEEFMPKRK